MTSRWEWETAGKQNVRKEERYVKSIYVCAWITLKLIKHENVNNLPRSDNVPSRHITTDTSDNTASRSLLWLDLRPSTPIIAQLNYLQGIVITYINWAAAVTVLIIILPWCSTLSSITCTCHTANWTETMRNSETVELGKRSLHSHYIYKREPDDHNGDDDDKNWPKTLWLHSRWIYCDNKGASFSHLFRQRVTRKGDLTEVDYLLYCWCCWCLEYIND